MSWFLDPNNFFWAAVVFCVALLALDYFGCLEWLYDLLADLQQGNPWTRSKR